MQSLDIIKKIKANGNIKIMRKLKEYGIHGIDAVSPLEIKLAQEAGYETKNILYTENYISS